MSNKLYDCLLPGNWPLSVHLILATTLFLAFWSILTRPSFPQTAPKLVRGWPLLGSLGFFRARADFLTEGKLQSPNGQFSFYYGPHAIVALSGQEARLALYGSRGLNFAEGVRNLFAAGPNVRLFHGNLVNFFLHNVRRFVGKERMVPALPYLVNDTQALISKHTSTSTRSTIFSPFDEMWSLVYQTTHRLLGCHDIADDPVLLRKTLAIYAKMDKSSALEIMFPSLPTPNKLKKLWAGVRLYWILTCIIDERRKSGRRRDDAMQTLIDQGDSNVHIGAFTIGALFAALINTSLNAAWVLCFLAQDQHWYSRTRDEVDKTLLKYRESDAESPMDIFKRLTLDQWETEFPLIGLSLRESLRFVNLSGIAMRRNTSGKDIEIGNTGQVIPKGAYGVYLTDEVHFNEDLYPDPWRWDPGRYLPDRAEDKKAQHGFLGWGAGLHACLGTRLAKLEITISTAMFIACFDFDLCNEDGSPRTMRLAEIDRNSIDDKRPKEKVFLKLTPRV